MLKWKYFLVTVLTAVFIAGCLQQQTDIISTHLGELKDDSELLRATLLNVTEGVKMISHAGYCLHLPTLVLILFL